MAVEVAADPVDGEKVIGHGRRRQFSQLGRDIRQPEQLEYAGLIGRVGERAERRHVLWRSGGLDESRSHALRRSSVQLDGKAVGRHADVRLEDGDDVGVGGEPRPRFGGVLARYDHRKSFRGVFVAASIARGDPAEPLGDAHRDRERVVESHRSRRHRPPPVEGSADRRLGSRPDAGNLTQPPGRGRLAQLLGGLDPEGGADLRAATRAESEQAAESCQLGRGLTAKLLHLREPPGLDELAEPRLDPGPDPAQLADAAAPNEIGHRHRCRCDEVAAASEGAGGVRLGARELEKRGVLVEGCAELGVGRRASRHRATLPRGALVRAGGARRPTLRR